MISPTSEVRILIADDHEAVRRGIRTLLSSRLNWIVCGEAVDGVAAVEKAKELLPNLVLMDISMPRMDGLAAARIIRTQLPDTKVLIISQHDLTLVRLQANEIGASGFVSKTALARDLFSEIEAALAAKETAIPCQGTDQNVTVSNRAEHLTSPPQQNPRVGEYTTDDPVNILMIDDQPEKLLSYEAILAGTGEQLVRARSANEAFEHLLREDIGLILMDVNMPGQDGFELATTIRSHPRFQNIAIIFISGVHLTDADRLHGYATGAVDYILVPIIPELLRAKVKAFAELHRKTCQLEKLNREMDELSNRMIRLRDEERRRLARELHDGLGQELSAAKMAAGAIANSTNLNQAKERASESGILIESVIRQIRSLSHLLHPPLLDELGLNSALRCYVDGLTKRSGIETTIELQPPHFPRLSAELEIAIFRIIQEALTNVFRHAGAQKAQISVQLQDEHVVLKIRDDGKGITEQAMRFPPQGFGVGISGMKQRVKELAGTLLFRNTNPGTLVEAVIPLEMSARMVPANETAPPPVVPRVPSNTTEHRSGRSNRASSATEGFQWTGS